MDEHDLQPIENRCPSDEQLAQFAGGNLPPQETDQVAEHVEYCPTCQAKLAELDHSEHSSIDDLAKAGQQPLAFIDESNCDALLQQLEKPAPADVVFGLPGELAPAAVRRPAHEKQSIRLDRIGPYELLDQLGEGAMGSVFRGRHAGFGTVYAIKLLHPRRQDDVTSIERFQREMEAVGQLDHPNIVRAVDAGEEVGVQYLVMEYVEGTDLSRLSSRCGMLGVAESCELVRQAATGLDHAHRHGRVHRDVKPSNLMLSRDGTVKLLDLGLARLAGTIIAEETAKSDLDGLLDSSSAAGDLTRTHQVMGTLGYIAPEQASDSHAADARADIYSLGCTLYKLLAGRPPFGEPQYSTAVRQILAHAQAPVPPIRDHRPEVPEALAAIIERMLAKDPDQRYATAAEVAQVLEPYAGDADLRRLVNADADQPERDTDAGSSKTAAAPVMPCEPQSGQTARVRPRPRLSPFWLASAAACLAIVVAVVLLGRHLVPSQAPSVAANPARQGPARGPRVPPSAPASPPIDLLPLIDLERDAPQGHWTRVNGALVSKADQNAVIQIPYVPSEAYRIEATVERVAGGDGLGFGVVAGGQQYLIGIDNTPRSGYLSGPLFLDRRYLGTWASQAHRGRVLSDATPIELSCTVALENGETTVAAEANGKELFRWKGPAHRMSLTPDHKPVASRVLYLRSYNTSFAFRKLRVVPLAGQHRVVKFADRKTAPDLAAAQRLLWKGGRVKILHEGSVEDLGSLWDVPDDCRIRNLELPADPWFASADLAYLSNLAELQELDIVGIPAANSRLDLRGLTHLQRLNLSGTDVTAHQLAGLADLRDLRRLELTGTPIGDASLEMVSQLANIEELRLSETGITDAGIGRLAALKKLAHLELDHTPITDRALESLAKVPSLVSLSLNGTDVTDATITAIQKLPNLRRVSLLGTRLTRSEVERIEAERPQCRFVPGFAKLNLLDFADAERGSVVGKWQTRDGSLVTAPVAAAAFRLPVVPPDEYDLEAVVCRESGDDALVFAVVVGGHHAMIGFDHAHEQSSYLVLHALDGERAHTSPARTKGPFLPMGTDVRIGIRVRRNHIAVQVQGETRLEWQGDFSRLSGHDGHSMGEARTLGLGGWRSGFVVREWTLTPISGCADHVLLRPTPFTSEAALARRIQALGGTMQVTTGGTNAVELSPTTPLPEVPLWVRDISAPAGTRLTSDDFALLRATHDLQVLKLNGAVFDARLLAELRDLKWLRTVELNNTSVTDAGVVQIAKLPRLERLAICRASNFSDSSWLSLGTLRGIRSLDLTDTCVGDEAAEHIGGMKELRKLSLAGTRITNATVQAIATLPNLVELDLSRTAVTDASRDLLAGFKDLRQLNLKDSGASLLTVEQLRKSLPNCKIDGPLWGFLAGGAEPLHPFVPTGEAVDLLSLINLERDAVPNTWESEGKTLVSNRDQTATLKIPYAPPGEYRLEATVERRGGREGIQFGVIAGSRCYMILDGWPDRGYLNGPSLLDEFRLEHYANQSYRGQIVPDGTPIRISCTVLRAEKQLELRVARDGEDLFAWRGDASVLSIGKSDSHVIAPGALFLRVNKSQVRITELRLFPISGNGREISFADPSVNPELAAAQRALWKGGAIRIDDGATASHLDTFGPLPARFTIRRINTLGRPCFTGADLACFSNLPELRELDFFDVPVNATDLAGFSAIPSLEFLRFTGSHFAGDGGACWQHLKHLRRLDLTGATVDDATVAAIGQIVALEELRLGSSTISDEGVARLAGLTNLRSLNLDATEVTDRVIETLQRLPQLTELSMQGTCISDAAAEALASLVNLQRLRLLDTSVTDEGVARIQSKLPSCHVVGGVRQTIDLLQEVDPLEGAINGSWRIVDGALICPVLVAAKLRLPVVPPKEYDLEMRVRRTDKSGPLVCVIVAGDRRAMVSLDHDDHVILDRLDGKEDLASEAKTKRRTLPSGRDVEISIQVRDNRITVLADGATVLDWQGDFRRLEAHDYFSPGSGETLGLAAQRGGFVISRWTLKPIDGSPHFLPRYAKPAIREQEIAARVLELGGSVKISLGGNQSQQLTRNTVIPDREIRLGGTAVTGTGFRQLSHLNDLERIFLGSSKVTPEGYRHVVQFKKLRSLVLSGLQIADDELAPLAELSELRYLHVGWSKVTGPGLVHLQGLAKLETLQLDGAPISDDGLAFVGRLQQLHELRLWKTPITDAGLGHLAGLTGLTEMCLTETRVTDDGARKLLKGLPNCTIVFGDKKLTARDAEN